MRRVLIANRGEIALRAIRVCRRLGLESVAVYSSADANSPHRWSADHAICIGPPAPKSSYLSAGALIETAVALKCDAIYPGYGFLAENHAFAERSKEAGLTFIGPDSESIARMGDKVAARQAAAAAGIPIVPGSRQGYTSSGPAKLASADIGFPLLLKASGGGGGRGMRVVERAEDFVAQFEQASAEALAAFGNAEVYLERFFPQVRHIEIQIFGDTHGNYVHLGERDCSVQRRHQKLVEEAPSPALDDATRRQMAEAAVALIRTLKYVNAGTVEFIYDPSSGKFFFIEMNTRIQVEHPVTEEVTGIDLIKQQIHIANGEKLEFDQGDITFEKHAIECRINAEDPARNFAPSPGTIGLYYAPGGHGVRIDSHVYSGYVIPPYYDSMIGKLICFGSTRKVALERAYRALSEYLVRGIKTTIPLHKAIMADPLFIEGKATTAYMEEFLTRTTPDLFS